MIFPSATVNAMTENGSISANGTPKTSWSTKASRSAGVVTLPDDTDPEQAALLADSPQDDTDNIHNHAILRHGITPHHRRSFGAAMDRELGLRT
jgi:hypothetical protein